MNVGAADCTWLAWYLCSHAKIIYLLYLSKSAKVFYFKGTHWIWEIARMILTGDDSVSEKDSKINSFIENINLEKLNSLPSPRILSSHLTSTGLPASILSNSKVLVPIRHPKDTAVSMYHHLVGEKKGTAMCCDWNTFITDVWFNKDLGIYLYSIKLCYKY